MSRRRAVAVRNCSICRADVEGEGLSYRDAAQPGQPARDVGVYCGERCRDAAKVLAALAQTRPFTARTVVERRNEIADALLALWRRRIGPDPIVVLAAIERVNAPRSALVR